MADFYPASAMETYGSHRGLGQGGSVCAEVYVPVSIATPILK